MNYLRLIAVSNTQIDQREMVAFDTQFKAHLPTNGLTFLPTVEAFRKYVELTEKPKQVLTTNYYGRSTQKDTTVVSFSEMQNSNCLNLTDVSKDIKDPILKRFSQWLQEGDKSTLIDTLIERKLARLAYEEQALKLMRGEFGGLIACAPEFVSEIIKLPGFEHLDAIRYGAFLDNEIIDLITIFKDDHLMYVNDAEDYIVASVTGSNGKIKLPHYITNTKKRITQADIERLHEQQFKVA